MWRRTAKLASAAFLLAAFVYAPIASAQTAVPEAGKSKKIDDIKKRGVLKAAAIGEFPWLPENTSGSGPQFSGPAWMLAEDIAKRLGVKLEIVAVSHETKVPILATGQADITIAPLTITPARQKVVDFVPYSASSLCFFGLASNPKLEKLNSVDDLNSPDITMAYFTGTPPETWALPKGDGCLQSHEMEATTAMAIDKGDPVFLAWLTAVKDELKPKLEAEELRILKSVKPAS